MLSGTYDHILAFGSSAGFVFVDSNLRVGVHGGVGIGHEYCYACVREYCVYRWL